MSTQTYIQPQRPDFSRCYGITHTPAGAPIIREPKLLKVGIGVPKGPGIHVYRAEGVWKIAVGTKRENTQVQVAHSRDEAEALYLQLRKAAPLRQAPAKLPYFTFSRLAPDGALVPDFDAIEAHGEMPTEIDIVFLGDSPLEASYAMWATAELRCKGDGLAAMRTLSMAASDEERAAAADAATRGERYFPVLTGCAVNGCRYAQGETAACKPSGDLKFQLANNLRVGGTAYFHTTGLRSISQLFSALQTFRSLTGGGDPERGRIAGIPFKMLVRPYQTRHHGIIATQYGVSLEFRAETVAALRQRLIAQATEFRALIGGPGPAARQIQAIQPIDDGLGDETDQAAIVEQEFTVVDDDSPESVEPAVSDDSAINDEPERPTPEQQISARTEERATALKQRLTSARRKRGSGGAAATVETVAPQPVVEVLDEAPAPKDEEGFF